MGYFYNQIVNHFANCHIKIFSVLLQAHIHRESVNMIEVTFMLIVVNIIITSLIWYMISHYNPTTCDLKHCSYNLIEILFLLFYKLKAFREIDIMSFIVK